MADGSGNAPAPNLLVRAAQAARFVISGVSPNTWMSPLQPLTPIAPPEVKGRTWDFPVGINTRYQPRSTEPIDFRRLRALAEHCDPLRSIIQRQKELIEAFDWSIKPREVSVGHRPAESKYKTQVDAITSLLRKPDRVHDWAQWLHMLLEEVFVIDALAIYRRPTLDGKQLWGLEIISGDTLTPMVDENGRRPQPPSVAFQQVDKGVVAADFSLDELIYYPRSPRANRLYGTPPIQWVISYVETAIERIRSQKAYFTEGNMTDALFVAPADWTIDQVKVWQGYWDDMFSGNVLMRRHGWWVPGGDVKQIKQPPLKDEFDEWLIRLFCFAYSTSPLPFIKAPARGLQESQQEVAEEGGIATYMQYIKRVIDKVIVEDLQNLDLEFCWSEDREFDPEIAAKIDDQRIRNGSRTENEVRDRQGDDPYQGEWADKPFVIVPGQGVVWLEDAYELAQVAKEAAKTAPPPGESLPPSGGPPPKEGGAPPPGSGESGGGAAAKQQLAKWDALIDRELNKDVPTRLIITPQRGADGLFVQPPDVGPQREIVEAKHREFLANHFKYADQTTGLARTFDPDGDYNCGRCNQVEGVKCLLVKIPAVDRDAGSCAHWEDTCAGDPEMVTDYMEPDVSVYGVAKNGKGFGCHRCPFASRAVEPDSRGRSLYCGKADCRVPNNACCALNGAETWPADAQGMPVKGKKLTKRKTSIDVPTEGPKVRQARIDVAHQVRSALTKLKTNVVEQVRRKALTLGKDAADDIADDLDLSDLDGLPEAIEEHLADVAETAGNGALVQLGVSDYNQLTKQVAQRALVWARTRSAELVGKRWTADGELIDNPNPKWAISQSTRDMLRATISDALAANLSVPQLADKIANDYAFSDDRAKVVAETEVARANVQGSLEGAREARDSEGVVARKVWLLGQEPCDECQDNADQGPIDLDDDFDSGDDGPPAHPNCVCSLSWDISDLESDDGSE